MFDNLIFIGIFLGYSILQLLEYGVTTVVAQITKFLDFKSERVADREYERLLTSKSNNDSQDYGESDRNDYHIIELNQKPMKGAGIDWEERMKAMEQETREMKKEWEDMKRQNNTIRQFASLS